MQDTPIIIIISSLSIVVPSILGALLWPKLNKVEQGLARLLFVIGVLQVVVFVLSGIFTISNLPIYHVYLMLEINLLFLIYYFGIHQKKNTYVAWGVLAVSFVLMLANGLWGQTFMTFPAYMRSLESLVAILLAISYFRLILRSTVPLTLGRDPAFWISCGILIYYTTNLLLFMYGNYIQEQAPLVFDSIWRIHSYLNLVLYFAYTIALLCRKKT